MDERAYRAGAEAVRLVAVEARRESGDLDAHRAALARNALVWWQGGAAERYQQLVQERVNALAVVSQHLEGLACGADLFAAALQREADTAAAIRAVDAARPVLR
jgi:cyanophycinase-like exopeptidase